MSQLSLSSDSRPEELDLGWLTIQLPGDASPEKVQVRAYFYRSTLLARLQISRADKVEELAILDLKPAEPRLTFVPQFRSIRDAADSTPPVIAAVAQRLPDDWATP